MTDTVIATFEGPLDGFSINLSVLNSTTSDIRVFGISGGTAKFPLVWDSFGAYSGPATLGTTTGVDTEVVMVRFTGFSANETVRFTGIDPDFMNDNVSSVRVLDIMGAKAIALFADGTSAFAVFEPTIDGKLRAVLVK